jgi:hypothetical protein
LVVVIVCQVDLIAATVTAGQADPAALTTVAPAEAWFKPRTPTPTATLSVEALLTAVHSAVGTPEAPQSPEVATSLDATYENPDGFFGLDYPSSWSLSPRGGALVSPTDGAGLSMAIEIKAVNAETLAERYVEWYAAQVDDYWETDRRAGVVSGYPAQWVEQSFSVDGVAHHGVMAAIVRNRVGFVFAGWVPTTSPASLESTLRAMIQSVRIVEFAAAPPYSDWLTYETPHLTFHYLPDTWIDAAIEDIAAQHEQAFNDNVDYLDVEYDGLIDVYIYASEESFFRATARDAGFAINEFSEVHTRWFAENDHQTPGHEITHVITFHTMGEPSEALLGEGVAVWLDHGGNDYHRRCADLARSDRLVPLAELLGDGWDGSAAAYYEAGSFTGFLLERYGLDRFKDVYTAPDLPAALKRVYRASLTTLETKWLTALQ